MKGLGPLAGKPVHVVRHECRGGTRLCSAACQARAQGQDESASWWPAIGKGPSCREWQKELENTRAPASPSVGQVAQIEVQCGVGVAGAQ